MRPAPCGNEFNTFITDGLPLADESKDDDLSESIPDTTQSYQEITTCNFVIYTCWVVR